MFLAPVAAPSGAAAANIVVTSGDTVFGFPSLALDHASSTQVQGNPHMHPSTLALPGPTASDGSLVTVSSTQSAVAGDTEHRIRKSDLPEHEKVNIDRAFDLLVEDIIKNPSLGWDNSTIEVRGQECLSQASAENEQFPGLSSFSFRRELVFN